MITEQDILDVKTTIDHDGRKVIIYSLPKLDKKIGGNVSRLPFGLKILLESLLRNYDGKIITTEDIDSLAQWSPGKTSRNDIAFHPSRVVLQDFTGVPAVVDLAALRAAVKRHNGEPTLMNPVIPADLVIDHSVQVDHFGVSDARVENERMEFSRNQERYTLLKWAQKAFNNFRVVPPGRGIVHQVNLEYLASVVNVKKNGDGITAIPDTLVGTDSHTTMINGLGVLGWGVGGIEAEAVMLGQPYYMPVPEVVGFKLTGELSEGITATDLVLTVTKMLREFGVVGKFVEFYGQGLANLSLPDRATISNMSPEYGATMGFFPVDEATLNYLELTGRDKKRVALIRAYLKAQGLFSDGGSQEPEFTASLELNMGTVEPCVAGPKRPQDRIVLKDVSGNFHDIIDRSAGSGSNDLNNHHRWLDEGGNDEPEDVAPVEGENIAIEPEDDELKHGSIVIAAITSCTNTSNPSVLVGAGLLAKKASERGLRVKPWVKTSLAPGSRVVTDYLEGSGLLKYLEEFGFNIVGYGCTTCIGNSGPLPKTVARKVQEDDLTVAAVLSGNRNFEGRINPVVKANYLASPPLVVAYALAGTIDIDLTKEPLGENIDGKPVYLKDIWPKGTEIKQIMSETLKPGMFTKQYEDIFVGTENWDNLSVLQGSLYKWDPGSTYIQEPPFFKDFPMELPEMKDIEGARVLVLLGDSITTDHISPAGSIPKDGPAGQYLISNGVAETDFNSFGSRRGNHEVMMRGTFANIRIRNQLVGGKEGGWTVYFPTGEEITIYDAAMAYIENNIPLIVIAGKEYGTGSSRDWAAKGTSLLGVKAVIAESYERIHRSNLIGMGVLPLQFKSNENAKTLGLNGKESYVIGGVVGVKPGGELSVIASDPDKDDNRFTVDVRLDSDVELEYYLNGGILHKFLRDILNINA